MRKKTQLHVRSSPGIIWFCNTKLLYVNFLLNLGTCRFKNMQKSKKKNWQKINNFLGFRRRWDPTSGIFSRFKIFSRKMEKTRGGTQKCKEEQTKAADFCQIWNTQNKTTKRTQLCSTPCFKLLSNIPNKHFKHLPPKFLAAFAWNFSSMWYRITIILSLYSHRMSSKGTFQTKKFTHQKIIPKRSINVIMVSDACQLLMVSDACFR